YLTDCLVLYFTGLSRMSTVVAAEQKKRTGLNTGLLNTLTYSVKEGIKALTDGDIETLGELISESWKIKKSLSSNIATSEMDELRRRGGAAGAYGGKLLGAGGGGFLMFLCPPERRFDLQEAMGSRVEIKIKIDRE